MKRLLLICMLVALAVPASGLVALASGPYTEPGADPAMEAFARSVALTGQSFAGNAMAGPCCAPFGSLSMGPTEAEAYARSLAQTARGSTGVAKGPYIGPVSDQAIGAFVRSVALTGQTLVGYAVAGPCCAPFGTLSMSPTEATAYVRSLAQTAQGSTSVSGGGR